MSKTALQGPVRVRFAPSPTGHLHVGGARTAIYNDLLRQSLGGAFILRIEDTDRERSDEAMTRQIQSALRWLGTTWDEGPYLQSERLARHKERSEELVEGGKAYRCYRTKEELDEMRQAAVDTKAGAFRYREAQHRLPSEEEEQRAAAGEPFVVRFRMPTGHVKFQDLVRGDMDVPPDALDDFVLLRSDGTPTYHLSVVVDDIDMSVTHVLRGEDHLVNTAKHVPLFEAFGAAVPTFGHLPLILGPDKKRLSKRTGATSVEEFREQGILPQALYNFLALLGWSPGDDRELLSRQEMVELFTVERLNASAAVFDRDKLSWMNQQYLQSLSWEEIEPHLRPFVEELGLETAALKDADPERLRQTAELFRPRAETLREMAEGVVPYFQESIPYDPETCGKFLGDPDLPGHVEALRDRYANAEPFDLETLEQVLRELADELDVKAGVLIHPLRMALTGTKKGPGVFDVVVAQGRERTVRLLGDFVGFLRARADHQPS